MDSSSRHGRLWKLHLSPIRILYIRNHTRNIRSFTFPILCASASVENIIAKEVAVCDRSGEKMSGRPTTKTKTKENEELVDLHPRPHQEEYLQHKTVQKGYDRLERRPASGYQGLPRKSGHGGKYTWEGPRGEEEDEDYPAAIDEKDPNFIDSAQEELDRQVADGVVEVPKAPAAPQGVARIDLNLPHGTSPESEPPLFPEFLV